MMTCLLAGMPNRRVAGIGLLGARLALAFVAVALAAIAVNAVIFGELFHSDVGRDLAKQESSLGAAAALTAGAAYQGVGWAHADLAPVFTLARFSGTAVQIRNDSGRLIGSSRRFAAFPPRHARSVPVIVRGRRVGRVAVRYSAGAIGSMARGFESKTWRPRLIASGIAALIALVVSLIVARAITRPLEEMLQAVRARGAGRRFVRIERIRGVGVLRELLETFNQASRAVDERDRLQRNLVADVAHELRTPVAVLQASHEAMIDGVTEPTPDNLESLREEVLRLARMVDDLQRLAAAEAAALQLRLVPHDLSAVAAEAAGKLLDAFATAGVALEQQLASAMVRCDAARMREVVSNLLTNALKFTPQGGRVLLESGPVDGTGLARVRVSDSGIGIPVHELPHVTGRFFRGARSYEMAAGSGIGLTIVDKLVQAHCGELTIASEQDTGTQVTIVLPVADSAESRRARARPGQLVGDVPPRHRARLRSGCSPESSGGRRVPGAAGRGNAETAAASTARSLVPFPTPVLRSPPSGYAPT
jgi:two-component system sensor histidine kinase BaeS